MANFLLNAIILNFMFHTAIYITMYIWKSLYNFKTDASVFQ